MTNTKPAAKKIPCPRCDGTGFHPCGVCFRCHGSGVTHKAARRKTLLGVPADVGGLGESRADRRARREREDAEIDDRLKVLARSPKRET